MNAPLRPGDVVLTSCGLIAIVRRAGEVFGANGLHLYLSDQEWSRLRPLSLAGRPIDDDAAPQSVANFQEILPGRLDKP